MFHCTEALVNLEPVLYQWYKTIGIIQGIQFKIQSKNLHLKIYKLTMPKKLVQCYTRYNFYCDLQDLSFFIADVYFVLYNIYETTADVN